MVVPSFGMSGTTLSRREFARSVEAWCAEVSSAILNPPYTGEADVKRLLAESNVEAQAAVDLQRLISLR
jgi:hypothetical protein